MTSGTVFFPMPNSPSMSCAHGALILPSPPGRVFTAYPMTLLHTHSTPPVNFVCLSIAPITASLGIPTGTALTTLLGPALTHYRCHRVYIVSTRTERITLTLAQFPLPYFVRNSTF